MIHSRCQAPGALALAAVLTAACGGGGGGGGGFGGTVGTGSGTSAAEQAALVEEGKKILSSSGLAIVPANDLGDAARKIVAEVKAAA